MIRFALTLLAVLMLPTAAAQEKASAASSPMAPITVHKSPTCGCCANWVTYLRSEGFQVDVVDHDDLGPIKARYGVRPKLRSCHTASVGGYVIEGHVPADDIRRLLLERPSVIGLTAPGMPQMSPGMHSVEPKGYDVLTFDEFGNLSVFSKY